MVDGGGLWGAGGGRRPSKKLNTILEEQQPEIPHFFEIALVVLGGHHFHGEGRLPFFGTPFTEPTRVFSSDPQRFCKQRSTFHRGREVEWKGRPCPETGGPTLRIQGFIEVARVL